VKNKTDENMRLSETTIQVCTLTIFKSSRSPYWNCYV